MDQFLNQIKMEEGKSSEESKTADVKSRMAVVHSRYASRKNTMRDNQAHPVFDEQQRVAVFHNGFVTNYKELAIELYPHKDPSKSRLSDSELIALKLGKLLDSGLDIKTAIQTLIETKLLGTWRMAIMLTAEPDKMYIAKNVGPCFMGKSSSSVVICSDPSILTEQ